MVRAENIGDLFDHFEHPEVLTTMQFDLVEFCYSFWFEANHEVDPFDLPKNATLRQMWEQGYTALPLLDITEMDLTNNQPAVNTTGYKQTQPWRGEDDHLRHDSRTWQAVYQKPSNPLDAPLTEGVELAPQVIRVFRVTYRSFSEVMGSPKSELNFLQS